MIENEGKIDGKVFNLDEEIIKLMKMMGEKYDKIIYEEK